MFTVGLSLWSENWLWNFGKCPIYLDVRARGEAGIRRVIRCRVCGWTLRLLGSPRACTGAGVPVCLHFLQTVGFVLNVGQQNPSYVKGRRAGGQMQGESCWWLCSCGHGGGCGAHQSARAPLAVSRERHRKERDWAPMMKTVLSLHRKWAHAVKTIRILQGLVSAILIAA